MSIPVICDRCRVTGLAGKADFTHLGDLLQFDPVPVQPRVNGWDADAQRAFIALLATTGSKRQAAQAIGRNAHGIDQLLKREDSGSFRIAFDRALAIASANGSMKLAQGVADAAARNAQLTPPSRLRGLEPEDQASADRRADEARESISRKLLAARRLYLQEISASPGKRAAFEILTGFPIDWDKAERLEPQDDEPWRIPSMRTGDMLLTAENGWLGNAAHGADKMAELRKAIDEYREQEGMPPVGWLDDEYD